MSCITAFQDLLDDISECFLEQNYEQWRALLVLPVTVVSQDTTLLLETEDDVARNFQDYVKAVDAMSLDKVFRRPLSLQECDDGSFVGTYETNLLSMGQRIVEPYVSSMLLLNTPDGLRIQSIMNARGPRDWLALHGTQLRA